MVGYHKKYIEKGKVGEISKIKEEFEELLDANEQNNKVMELVELSDLLGAIDSYTKSKYNMTIEDLLVMTKLTQSVFESGHRK